MLIELLRLHAISLPPDADDLARLTPFGVALRYDDAAGEEELPVQREWAVDVVSRTIDWAAS